MVARGPTAIALSDRFSTKCRCYRRSCRVPRKGADRRRTWRPVTTPTWRYRRSCWVFFAVAAALWGRAWVWNLAAQRELRPLRVLLRPLDQLPLDRRRPTDRVRPMDLPGADLSQFRPSKCRQRAKIRRSLRSPKILNRKRKHRCTKMLHKDTAHYSCPFCQSKRSSASSRFDLGVGNSRRMALAGQGFPGVGILV